MKSHISNRMDIDLRPKEINLRLKTGDSIESGRIKGKKETAALLYWLID